MQAKHPSTWCQTKEETGLPRRRPAWFIHTITELQRSIPFGHQTWQGQPPINAGFNRKLIWKRGMGCSISIFDDSVGPVFFHPRRWRRWQRCRNSRARETSWAFRWAAVRVPAMPTLRVTCLQPAALANRVANGSYTVSFNPNCSEILQTVPQNEQINFSTRFSEGVFVICAGDSETYLSALQLCATHRQVIWWDGSTSYAMCNLAESSSVTATGSESHPIRIYIIEYHGSGWCCDASEFYEHIDMSYFHKTMPQCGESQSCLFLSTPIN